MQKQVAPREWDYVEDESDTFDIVEAAHKTKDGMRYFIKLMEQHTDSFKKSIAELHQIADNLDDFHYGATVASITGSAVSVAGGIATIVGLIASPFSFGTSLILTEVGLGVAAAGGITSATATISDTVNDYLDRKKVEEMIQQYEKNMKDIDKCLKGIQQLLERIRNDENFSKFTLHDLEPVMILAMPRLGRGIVSAAEIVRLVKLSKVTESAVEGIRSIAKVTGVLAGIFLLLDAFSITKDAIDLQKGAKAESAANIRQAADDLEKGFKELCEVRNKFEETPSQP
ncbi:apolipoprotein L domain-containing protein 1-like [Rhinatrema bivittatum]|uniref:apolipoprotein L domain-containing protein 1-like n=1 Tax=Rhinatrema bivittatum TaxID=194408 RepID=UPI00112DB9AC|nr:apolipoprotein L domain-containing protein 1-like [Rhinatrema bivittatum]